ncbi:MAG: DUF5110 domain-containing protein [Lentisphaerae bacterium]|nr:DUF5110 domain-containing protein [Lentisphaerota bacterium]MCP4101529.1 DUF5110 domain-containing protein [Lentisphaerota bacterium]
MLRFRLKLFATAWLLCLALFIQAGDFVNSTGELIGDRIARFVPDGLNKNDLPYSFALQKNFQSAGTLPGQWELKPSYFIDDNGATKTVVIDIPASYDLYGGGEVTGPLRRNGTFIKLWNTDSPSYNKDNGSRLYQSHPWVLGLRPDGSAFGVLFDTTWKAELDLRWEGKIVFKAASSLYPVYIIDRDSPQEVLRGLSELTGTMDLPPLWSLGYQQCRWSYYPESRVREIADTFRAKNIPCDVIWMDIHYMDGHRIFTFDKERFPDPDGLSNYLHNLGFKGVWMIDPGVKKDDDFWLYQSGSSYNLWVKDSSGKDYVGEVWPGACVFPDFTSSFVRAWWADLYYDFMRENQIDGIWNDMNEPASWNGPDATMPENNRHIGGGPIDPGPHLQYHNVYGMLMVMATREGLTKANPDKRPFVLSRANFMGGQRYAAMWTGDNTSSWDHLKLSVPMSLTIGLSGQPFSGPDLGGFFGEVTADLWGNWIAMGAFFPFCRGHACEDTPDKEPWAFGADVENAARTALERRYRLLPYYYTLFREASIDGMPVMRPVFMADPSDHALRNEQRSFLIGDSLLIVPHWAKDAAEPQGIWQSVKLLNGDRENDNFQSTIKIRGGAIIPLGEVVQNTAHPEKMLAPLTLLVVLNEKGTADGSLFWDSGDGYGYENGDYSQYTFHAEQQSDGVHVNFKLAGGKQLRVPVSVKLYDSKGAVKTATGNCGEEIIIK